MFPVKYSTADRHLEVIHMQGAKSVRRLDHGKSHGFVKVSDLALS